jgi:hypothetical protein
MTSDTQRDNVAREQFLRRVQAKQHRVEPDTVIARENVYRVDGAVHLMVRTSKFHERQGVYFFGLTRHIFENYEKLPRAVIAFVFSDTSEALLVPAKWMWQHRDALSSNAKQFKLEINKLLHLRVRAGVGNPIDLSRFRERFQLLRPSIADGDATTEKEVVPGIHSALQGMLLEIGNVRGFQTYCPNKSPLFSGRALGDIATVKTFPDFPGMNVDIARQIDVVWFERSFPVHAFEVELTTGIWTGLVRLGELRRLNTIFHVVTNTDQRIFTKRVSGDIFADIIERCHHASAKEIASLHKAELAVHALRDGLKV